MQGVRKQQKEATRQRVVSAARDLFDGVGECLGCLVESMDIDLIN